LDLGLLIVCLPYNVPYAFKVLGRIIS